MAGRRQAWCARCDELRPARPGAACPACGRALLPVPTARSAEPRGGRAARAASRLAAALPALRAASTGLVVLAVVAGAFAAGRITRTTPPSQPGPSSTLPGLGEAGQGFGRGLYEWRATARNGVRVTLHAIDVRSDFSQLELNVGGLAAGEVVASVHGLRIRDAAGNDLVAAAQLDDLSPSSSQPLPGQGGFDAQLPIATGLDWRQVAAVSITGLTVSHPVSERLRGTVVDRDVQGPCAGCRVEVAPCGACRTVQLVASEYERPAVVLVLAPRGPLARSALRPGGEATVEVAPDGGELISSRDTAPDGVTVVGFNARELAFRTPRRTARMGFSVRLDADAEREVHGPWTMTRQGSAP